ncbi:hypothetical protein GOP47_0011135, partial [Adiantum capillus-veneris]
ENGYLPLVLSHPPTLVEEVLYGVGFTHSSEHIDDEMQPLEGVGFVAGDKSVIAGTRFDDIVLIEDVCDGSSVSNLDVSDGYVVPI